MVPRALGAKERIGIMRQVFYNSKGELRLVWIWTIGIAIYYAINLGIGNLYKWILFRILPLEGAVSTGMMLTADLLLELPIIALTIIISRALYRYLLNASMCFEVRPLLIACGAVLAAITAAVLALSAMGRLHIVRATVPWMVDDPKEYALATAVHAPLSVLSTIATAVFRYGFLCGSAFKRMKRRAALLACLLIFGACSLLNSSGGVIWKINGVLTVALTLLALNLAGAGAGCGVPLGMLLGLGVFFGAPNSVYTLMQIIPACVEASIAPVVADPLTGGSAGAWGGLWLTAVLALLIAIALLCHERVRELVKRAIASGGME